MPSAIPSRRLYLGAAGVSALVVVMAALLLISQLATATITSGGAFVAGATSTDLVAGKIDAEYDLEFSSTSTTSSLAVIVTFPAGYAIASTSTVQDASSTPGTITIGGASVPVTVTTDQASSTIRIAFAGTTTTNDTIRLRVLTGVTNPLSIGLTGSFGIAYEGNAGNITDEKTDVLGVIIVAQSSMYVDDALGSDSNDCLSPGAGACKTIQFAIDRLVSTTTATTTVNVAAGTYTEENVVIDKTLTLQGAGTSTKIAPADGDGIEINASNVTVDSFSIEPLHSGADGFGIDISGTVTTTGVTISNNVITTVRAGSAGTKGISVSTAPTTELTVTGNTISVTSSNPGFESVPSAAAHSGWTITNNTFTDHTGTNLDLNDVDVLTVDSNIFGVSTGSSSVTIDSVSALLSGPIVFTNNDVNGSTGGRMVTILAAVGIDDVYVRRNKFDNWATAAVRYGTNVTTTLAGLNGFMQSGGLAVENDNTNAIVNTSGSWWATIDEDFIDNTSTQGLVDFTPFLAVGTDTDSATGFQGDYSSLYVTSLGEQTGTFGRIQQAVNLVTSSTISVLPGTYTSADAININKPNLTLRSTGGAGTTSTPITLITRVCCLGPVISVSSTATSLTIGGDPGEGFVINSSATTTDLVEVQGGGSPDNVTISYNVFDLTEVSTSTQMGIDFNGAASNLAITDNGGYVNRCVNDIRRRPSQPLSQRRSHPRIERRDRRLRSTQGPSDA